MRRRPARLNARRAGEVPLARALSKLGVTSRADATVLVLAGRVSIDGRPVRDPSASVVPERIRITIDGRPVKRAGWRLILLHKPRGVVTTRHDPEGRPTVFELLGDEAPGLVAVGRLDLATTGLLLLTTDTKLANWLTDPAQRIVRRYVVTVRGCFADADAGRLTQGIGDLRAHTVQIRKRSGRETHLTIELVEGRNREIRRLCAAVGHEVTSLKRVTFGGLELGTLPPGAWRRITAEELARAFAVAVPTWPR